MTITLILVRHGESEHNVNYPIEIDGDEIQDPSLTMLGEVQASLVGKFLHERFGSKVTDIIVSPMLRTLQTARYFCKLMPDKEISVVAGIAEKSGYRCSRDVTDSVKPSKILGSKASCLDHEAGNWYRAGMAEEDDVTNRAFNFLINHVQGQGKEFVSNSGEDKTIICFTHSLFMSELTKMCLGISSCLPCHNANCSLTILRSENRGYSFELLCQNYNPLPLNHQTGLQF